MVIGDQMKGKEPAPVDDKFPEGMRVLAIDDNPVCLKLLERFLRCCKYKPTMVTNGNTALDMLREGGKDKFDLVITDVHMPDMDGFKLLELIGLETDLPVIMLSVNGERETILKGITHGVCEYLVKPVHIEELKNIWQHVVRRKNGVVKHISSEEDDAYQRVQPGFAEDEQSGANSKKCSKNKKNDGDHSDENKERMAGVANRKKPRVTWSGELHRKFVNVVEHLSIDRAVPKKILEMMDVDYLTRESVASHLQKYRFNLKRVKDGSKSDPLRDSSERRTLSPYLNMYHQGSSSNHHEHQRGQPSPTLAFGGSNTLFAAPSVIGAGGVSVQSRNWDMGTVGHGGSMLRHDSRRPHASGPPVNSFPGTSDHIMLDALPPSNSGKEYVSVLRQKMLQASNVVPPSHPGSSFAQMQNGGMSVNQFQVQPPEPASQYYGLMNMAPSVVSAYHDTQFPCLVGSSSNPWQNVASSSSPAYMNGRPLAPSQVNISQLPSFAASPGHILPMIQNEEQNQMEGIINTNTGPVAGISEQTAPFNMASNTAPFEMTNENFSHMTQMVNGGSATSALPNLQADVSFLPTQMVNGGSISSALPELHAGSSVTSTQMVNGGENALGALPMQEGTVELRALDDQPIYSDPFLVDDYANMLNQDLTDDAFLTGGY